MTKTFLSHICFGDSVGDDISENEYRRIDFQMHHYGFGPNKCERKMLRTSVWDPCGKSAMSIIFVRTIIAWANDKT